MESRLPERLKRIVAPPAQFLDGFLFFFRAVPFLARHPILWPYALLPFLINGAIVVASAIALVYFFPDLSGLLWKPPEAWYLWLLYLPYLAVLFLLIPLIAYVLFFMILPGITSPPFKGKLCKHARQIIKKQPVRPAGGFWIDVVMPTVIEIRKGVRVLLTSVLLLPVNLVPVVGQGAYLVLVSYFTWWNMALNNLEYPLDSESWVTPLPLKRKFVSLRRWPALGLGCAISLTYLIPFLNFFTVSVGVIGATLLYHAYGEQAGLWETPPQGRDDGPKGNPAPQGHEPNETSTWP